MARGWLSVVLVAFLAGCGGKTDRGGTKSRKSRAEEASRAGRAESDEPGASQGARPRPEGRPSSPRPSPTSLPECDRYLDALCRCAGERPDKKVLQVACTEAKKSLPKWRETSAKEPEQRQAQAESCRKALAEIQRDFGCSTAGREGAPGAKGGRPGLRR